MSPDYSPSDVMDRDTRANRYYRNAVERHWDPGEIDLERDRENFLASSLATMDLDALGFEGGNEAVFDEFRTAIAMFGAGEEAVTEDLAPLAVVLEDIDDQLFLTTQLYEEAKHADFFDRYWREVIHPIEAEMGWERSDPRDEQWFNDAYLELFERNRRAQYRLLEDGGDTPKNRALAYCHYHVTVEAILAQSGYYGLTTLFGGEDVGAVPMLLGLDEGLRGILSDETRSIDVGMGLHNLAVLARNGVRSVVGGDTVEIIPTLPGLVEGIDSIRSDEGRHVGFGMHKLKTHLREGQVDPRLVRDTVDELAALVVEALSTFDDDTDDPDPLNFGALVDVTGYATQKRDERAAQIDDAASEVPAVDELVRIEAED